MDTEWGSSWRRNLPAMRKAYSRRMVIINEVQALAKKPQSNVNKALQQLELKYADMHFNKVSGLLQQRKGKSRAGVVAPEPETLT